MKILIHYVAFQSNQAFEYTGPVGDSASFLDLLELIFRQCNVVDGTEWVVQESARRMAAKQKGLRSMNVGDIVTFIDGTKWESYLCAGVGWELVGRG